LILLRNAFIVCGHLQSVKEYLEYSKLKVKTLDDFCKYIIETKDLIFYRYRAIPKAITNVQFQLDEHKEGLENDIFFIVDWDVFFDELNILELRLNELLIIYENLILIGPKDEELKTLKLKREMMPFERININLKKIKIEFNKIGEQALKLK
jgi:hypothetical protein